MVWCCTSCTREEVALVAGRGCLFVFHVPTLCLWLLLLFKVWLLMHCLCLKSWLYNVFIVGGVVIHTFNTSKTKIYCVRETVNSPKCIVTFLGSGNQFLHAINNNYNNNKIIIRIIRITNDNNIF